MSAELTLRFATDELERALKQAEAKRQIWLIARVAHPSVLNIDAAIECAEAACELAEVQLRYDEALMNVQSDWAARQSDSSSAADPKAPGGANRGSAAFGEPLISGPTPSTQPQTVRFPVLYSRED